MAAAAEALDFETAAILRDRLRAATFIQGSQAINASGVGDADVFALAAKGGQIGWSRSMAVELAPGNIRVNALAPTFIDTPLTRPMLDNRDFRRFVLDRIPLGRVARVGDIAAAVLFLSSAGAGMITGESLRIDGGWTAQ